MKAEFDNSAFFVQKLCRKNLANFRFLFSAIKYIIYFKIFVKTRSYMYIFQKMILQIFKIYVIILSYKNIKILGSPECGP